jgi:hypothetical protein
VNLESTRESGGGWSRSKKFACEIRATGDAIQVFLKRFVVKVAAIVT